jgi:hypothetical protein
VCTAVTALMEYEATISINNGRRAAAAAARRKTIFVNKFNYTRKSCSIKVKFSLQQELAHCQQVKRNKKYVSLRCTQESM